MWYGFGSQQWMMWSAGVLASVSSISYPAMSAFISMYADDDKQVSNPLCLYGLCSFCLWSVGVLESVSSSSYPAMSAFISIYAD